MKTFNGKIFYKHLPIPDVIMMGPRVFKDGRGFFFESYHQGSFDKIVGSEVRFVQDNHSKSSKDVLRGLHYQLPPFGQGKLVRVVNGMVFDVAVDIRRNSPTFGKWIGEILSADNQRQLWIPEGFAHGFVVLSETADFVYKATNYYHKEYERCILWNDPKIGINWECNGNNPKVSSKDQIGRSLEDAEVFL